MMATTLFLVPGRQVTAVDANGAGDAFAGSFLYALNAGLGFQTAAQLAILVSSEVAAQSCLSSCGKRLR